MEKAPSSPTAVLGTRGAHPFHSQGHGGCSRRGLQQVKDAEVVTREQWQDGVMLSVSPNPSGCPSHWDMHLTSSISTTRSTASSDDMAWPAPYPHAPSWGLWLPPNPKHRDTAVISSSLVLPCPQPQGQELTEEGSAP